MVLTCARARALASDYIDGDVDPATARALERHLQDCSRCPPLMAGLTAVLAGLRALPEIDAEPAWLRDLARPGRLPERNL
ncbi:MAG: hypothetical protein NVS3B26_26780 [Mycobacteriales bacterium]